MHSLLLTALFSLAAGRRLKVSALVNASRQSIPPVNSQFADAGYALSRVATSGRRLLGSRRILSQAQGLVRASRKLLRIGDEAKRKREEKWAAKIQSFFRGKWVRKTRQLQRRVQEVLGTDWKVGDKLGHGSCAQVWELTTMKRRIVLGRMFEKEEQFAGKFIERDSFSDYDKEIAMQMFVQTRHGSNIHIVNAESGHEFENGDRLIIMELMPGGTLIDNLDQFREAHQVQAIFGQIVDGVRHMHEAGVVHLDLKPNNVFCSKDQTSPLCKIGDFGFATKASLSEKQLTACSGTPEYASPEIYYASESNPYWGREVDVWALGVTLYVMLANCYPFDSTLTHPLEREHDIAEKICHRPYLPLPEEIGADAKDLIDHMLDKNPATRYTIQQVADHPYLNSRRGLTSFHTWFGRASSLNAMYRNSASAASFKVA